MTSPATTLALVLTEMATAVSKRDGMPQADFAHYSLKFALIAGAEKALEIAKSEQNRKD